MVDFSDATGEDRMPLVKLNKPDYYLQYVIILCKFIINNLRR